MEIPNSLEENSNDDDRALSFCDLVTEREVQEIGLRDSNTGSLDQEGFGFDVQFDFNFGCSTTENVLPADDLFRHGYLLPLEPQICRTESLQYSSFEKSISEYLQTWRNDSMDSQSSLWSTSNSSSKRKTHSGEILRSSNSKSKGNRKPSASGGKMSAIWRVLTLGLIKTPPMKLEDMRLRQGKTNNTICGEKNVDLRQSVSLYYCKDTKFEGKEAKDVNFEEKYSSGKEIVEVKKMPWFKGWKTLGRLPPFHSRKSSSNVVVDNGRLQKA